MLRGSERGSDLQPMRPIDQWEFRSRFRRHALGCSEVTDPAPTARWTHLNSPLDVQRRLFIAGTRLPRPRGRPPVDRRTLRMEVYAPPVPALPNAADWPRRAESRYIMRGRRQSG